jgi:hypothetical protein
MKNKNVINEWINVIENSSEFQCNHCGSVFKGNHECDYEKLKEMNKELISLNLWSARRLKHQQYKDFAYDELDKITGQKHERV